MSIIKGDLIANWSNMPAYSDHSYFWFESALDFS